MNPAPSPPPPTFMPFAGSVSTSSAPNARSSTRRSSDIDAGIVRIWRGGGRGRAAAAAGQWRMGCAGNRPRASERSELRPARSGAPRRSGPPPPTQAPAPAPSPACTPWPLPQTRGRCRCCRSSALPAAQQQWLRARASAERHLWLSTGSSVRPTGCSLRSLPLRLASPRPPPRPNRPRPRTSVVLPGVMAPLASASSIMLRPMRSFTLQQGCMISSLAGRGAQGTAGFQRAAARSQPAAGRRRMAPRRRTTRGRRPRAPLPPPIAAPHAGGRPPATCAPPSAARRLRNTIGVFPTSAVMPSAMPSTRGGASKAATALRARGGGAGRVG
jgi:hypothetical protein